MSIARLLPGLMLFVGACASAPPPDIKSVPWIIRNECEVTGEIGIRDRRQWPDTPAMKCARARLEALCSSGANLSDLELEGLRLTGLRCAGAKLAGASLNNS